MSEAWLDWNVVSKIIHQLANNQKPNEALDVRFLYEAEANAKFWESRNGRSFTRAEVGRLIIDKIEYEGLGDDFVKPLRRLVESLEDEAQDDLVTDVEYPLSTTTLTNTCMSGTATITNSHTPTRVVGALRNSGKRKRPATVPTYVIVVRQEGDTWVGRWEAGNGNTEADTLEECLANMAEVIALIQEGE